MRSVIGSDAKNLMPFGLNRRFGDSANKAIGDIGTALANQGSQFADSLSNTFGSYTGGAANMFNTYGGTNQAAMGNIAKMFGDYSNAFAGYGNTIGNIAGNAAANRASENAGRYAAWSGLGQGFNDMLGQIGSSSLAAYGSAANSAMQAQAMRESAALKAMADLAASNQAAVSSYGGQQAGALAALANAYGNAGSSLANSRGNVAAAASNLGVGGSNAFANLGSGIANAASNASTGQSAGSAALANAIANALSGLTVGEQTALANNAKSANDALAGTTMANANALTGLGNATAALGGSLGGSTTTAAGNSLNFTRDMAKLGLAELLGIGGLNVASQGTATAPYIGGGGGGGTGGITITAPDGVIASGGGGGYQYGGGGGGVAGSPPGPININPAPSWFRSPQYGDGGAMAGLSKLGEQGFGTIGSALADNRSAIGNAMSGVQSNQASTAGRIAGTSDATRQALTQQGAAGATDIRNAFNRSMGTINNQGRMSQAGIGSSLLSGFDEIGRQGSKIDGDADRMFAGIDAAGAAAADRGVLDSLNNNLASTMGTLNTAYMTGRQDPRVLLNDVFGSVQVLQNPLLGLANQYMGQLINQFPQPLQTPGQPGFMDPTPYLAALQSGWAPFMSGLDSQYATANANVMGALAGFNNEYRNQAGSLANQYGNAAGGINSLYDKHMDEIGGMFDPEKQAAAQIAADRMFRDYGEEMAMERGDRYLSGYRRRANSV